MNTYEILSLTSNGTLTVVCTARAKNEQEARSQTANFCDMMDITVHTVALAGEAPANRKREATDTPERQPLPGLEGGPFRGGGYTPLPCRRCGNDWTARNCSCELPRDARYDW
jgi:hypothetical protein